MLMHENSYLAIWQNVVLLQRVLWWKLSLLGWAKTISLWSIYFSVNWLMSELIVGYTYTFVLIEPSSLIILGNDILKSNSDGFDGRILVVGYIF